MTKNLAKWFRLSGISAAIILSGLSAFAQSDPAPTGQSSQPRPLLQDIQVTPSALPPAASPSLVRKTGSAGPIAGGAISADPVLANVEIPGTSGILVQTLDGKTIVDSASNVPFNPASNVKIATAYAVLKTFGPEYRFPTNVWTDGSIDSATATLNGNLYISGKDPIFAYEHAVAIAHELNRLGIRNVSGDLIVTDNFAFNHSNSVTYAGKALFMTLDPAKRPAAATKSWLNYLKNSGKLGKVIGVPGLAFTGNPYTQSIPSNLKLLFTHESAPMKDIVKVTLCYSNNFLAERLGDMLGGPYAVARVVQLNTGAAPSEFYLQTSSGLGINRVTPSSMMKLLRVLGAELARNKMTFADIMPVAGIDKGTLENRFDTDFSKGSVVGKTGTLGNTDGGVSSLAGEINTRNGKLLFVVFNQRGRVATFKSFQNSYISLIQGQFGGAAPMKYNPVDLDVRLARSRISYASSQSAAN